MNFHGDVPTADIASVIKAPLAEYPTNAEIKTATIKLCTNTFCFNSTVQETSNAPAKTTTQIPSREMRDSFFGSAPRIGIAGILSKSKEIGETIVCEPTAKPTPEKYARVETIAFGR